MAQRYNRWRLPVLIAAALLCASCSWTSLPYFLVPGADKLPPQLVKLAPEDKKTQVRVVILAYGGPVTQPEFVTADRELTGMLSRNLEESFKEDKAGVTIMPNGQVTKYKDSHPNWHLDLEETARHFKADYLVYLDIQSLSMYEKGCFNQLYHGQGDVHVTVIDMHKPDEYHPTKDYHCDYPRSMPVPVEDRNSQEFQRAFLDDIAKHLSWYFVDHTAGNEVGSE